MRLGKGQALASLAILTALVATGCRLPSQVGAQSEGQLATPHVVGQKLHALALRGPDGQALKGAATVRVNGKVYPTTDGVVLLPEAVLKEAVAAGGLVVTTPGFAPVRVPVDAQFLAKLDSSPGALTTGAAVQAPSGAGPNGAGLAPVLSVALPSLREAALPATLGPAGGVASLPGGAVNVSLAPGLLSGNASVVASAYTPTLSAELTQRQGAELAKLEQAVAALGGKLVSGGSASAGGATGGVGSGGGSASGGGVSGGGTGAAGGACGVPFGCAAPSQALGVNLMVDGALSPEGGSLKTHLDLTVLLRGWSGEGTPPWEVDPASWSESAKADALAAAKILAAFKAMDATGDPTWREAMKQAHGVELKGQVLSFPVQVGGGAASADGLTRVQVGGLSVLGVGLEVTVMSAVGQGLPQELTAGTALVGRVGGAVGGTVGATVGGAVGSVVGPTAGSLGGALASVVTNGPQLIANQGGNLLSNNGSTLVAGAQLLSNNGSTLISNHGGAIMGSAYIPMVPPLSQYRLLQLGLPEAPRVRTTTGGVKEYLWTDNSVRVRAVSANGGALTDWVPTDDKGTYVLPIQGNTPAAFFIEVEGLQGTVHARAIAFAPGNQRSWVEVNSASTALAQTTRFLQAFLPAELNAVNGLYDYVTDKDSPYSGRAEGAAVDYLNFRGEELSGALNAMNLALYGSDVARTQGTQRQAAAEQIMRMGPPVEVYDKVFADAYSFTSVQLVTRFTNLPPP